MNLPKIHREKLGLRTRKSTRMERKKNKSPLQGHKRVFFEAIKKGGNEKIRMPSSQKTHII